MTSKRQRRVRREILAAGAVYSGPFENEWLVTKPDTMPAGPRRLLRALVLFHGHRGPWGREEFLRRYDRDPFATMLKHVYNEVAITRLQSAPSPFMKLLAV